MCRAGSGKEFSDDAMAVLASQLTELGTCRGQDRHRNGLLPAGDFARLQAALPKAAFVSCEHILALLRQIKSPEEVVLLAQIVVDRRSGDCGRYFERQSR